MPSQSSHIESKTYQGHWWGLFSIFWLALVTLFELMTSYYRPYSQNNNNIYDKNCNLMRLMGYLFPYMQSKTYYGLQGLIIF